MYIRIVEQAENILDTVEMITDIKDNQKDYLISE